MTRVMCAVRQGLATRIKRYRRALVSGASGCNVLPLPADVAQLVEQRFRKPQVTGSNPVVGSDNFGSRIADTEILPVLAT